MPVKYTDELKARAVELVMHAQADPDSANGAITRVANELGLSKKPCESGCVSTKTLATLHRRSQLILRPRTAGCVPS